MYIPVTFHYLTLAYFSEIYSQFVNLHADLYRIPLINQKIKEAGGIRFLSYKKGELLYNAMLLALFIIVRLFLFRLTMLKKILVLNHC